jgi:tRNA pseudouridine38-40 synthase
VKIKLSIEYNGMSFNGWQRQPDVPTVQGEIEDALWLFILSLAKKKNTIPSSYISDGKITLHGSGRTDAGVSAREQIASFVWPDILEFNKNKFLRAINAITHRDISILDALIVDDTFDARRSAKGKVYSYVFSIRKVPHAINRQRIWHIPGENSLPLIEQAISCFTGTHDFNAFRASDCTGKRSERIIFQSFLVKNENGTCTFYIKGNSFLKHMVRMIIGEVMEVSRGRSSISEIERLLGGGLRKKRAVTAPAEPLTLEKVFYDDLSFPVR